MTVPPNATDLGRGAWYRYQPEWIPGAEADALLEQLTDALTWEHRAINALGKEVMQPRLIAWAGELPYRYSGQTLEPRAPEGPLAELLQRASDAAGHPFNHMLLNRYRDGRDNMASHADNEPELGLEPLIAALSLGVTRRFVLRPKDKRIRKKKKTVFLEHGSLLIMGGNMQHTWRHAIPSMPQVKEPRINLTFRQMRGPPGWRHWEQRQA